MLYQVLVHAGYTVEIAFAVQDAREILFTRRFDILLTDILLPDGKGWDVLQMMQEQGPTKAIAVSGLTSPEDVERIRSAGFDRFLPKPVQPDVLLATVDEVMNTPLKGE
jgi:DNA-binding response OmpR family regulator